MFVDCGIDALIDIMQSYNVHAMKRCPNLVVRMLTLIVLVVHCVFKCTDIKALSRESFRKERF